MGVIEVDVRDGELEVRFDRTDRENIHAGASTGERR
jgi:hypothetical protein